jgi:hypothetical protein
VTRDKIVWLLIGAGIYYGFLRFRGVVAGMPWAPTPVARAAS